MNDKFQFVVYLKDVETKSQADKSEKNELLSACSISGIVFFFQKSLCQTVFYITVFDYICATSPFFNNRTYVLITFLITFDYSGAKKPVKSRVSALHRGP